MTHRNYITECSYCRDWKEKDTHIFYTPTSQERRKYYFDGKHLSHGICPPCYVLSLRQEGFTTKDIEKIVEETK